MNTRRGYGISHDFDLYRAFFDQAPVCIHELDADGRLLSMNRAGLDLVGVDSEAQVRGRAYLDFISPSERERIQRLMDDAFKGDASEFEFSATGSAPHRYFYSCFVPCPDANGKINCLIGISSDITARKEAAAELQRLNRTHAVLSRCNNDLARSVDEDGLLNAFCGNLVEIGGYLFAWVGYVQPDSAKGVRMMAHAGPMGDDFSLTTITWADDDWKYSACGQCIRTGRPVVFRDIEHDTEKASGFAPWREAALRQGARSMIALPLKTDGQPFGNFSIFSTQANAFSEEELTLLTGLAEDLAFGIETTRARVARKQRVRRLREEVEQAERRRRAATLHDGVAQSLQAINLGLKRLRALSTETPQPHAELLDQTIDDVTDIIGELQDVSQELRPFSWNVWICGRRSNTTAAN
jgi:PAS domain S-box-containing protein